MAQKRLMNVAHQRVEEAEIMKEDQRDDVHGSSLPEEMRDGNVSWSAAESDSQQTWATPTNPQLRTTSSLLSLEQIGYSLIT